MRSMSAGGRSSRHPREGAAIQNGGFMRKRLRKLLIGLCPAGALVLQFQGCIFQDPDVGLRAGLSLASDLAIFLLENATAGL